MSRPGHPRSDRLAIVALLAACAAAAPALAGDGPPALSSGERGLLARSSGHNSELVETIEIERRPAGSRTVVMSLGPQRLPTLRRGTELTTSAEVQLTTTCVRVGERCIGNPYRYNPRIGAQLVLASSRDGVGAAATTQLSDRIGATCSQRPSKRNHHCPLVIDATSLETPPPSQLPCDPANCFINLVVDASSPNAGDGEKLIVGIDSDSGRILQDKGRLNAIIRAPGTEVDQRAFDTRQRRVGEIEMTAGGSGERTVVYSLPLRGLRVGDVIDARALQIADIDQLDYAAFIGNQLIVTDSPRLEHPGPIARRAITYRGEITEMNGFNCTQAETDYSSPCRSAKTGIAAVRRDPVDARGRPVPLYVNLVARAFPKRVGLMPNDVAKVRTPGYLRVRRLRELGL